MRGSEGYEEDRELFSDANTHTAATSNNNIAARKTAERKYTARTEIMVTCVCVCVYTILYSDQIAFDDIQDKIAIDRRRTTIRENSLLQFFTFQVKSKGKRLQRNIIIIIVAIFLK